MSVSFRYWYFSKCITFQFEVVPKSSHNIRIIFDFIFRIVSNLSSFYEIILYSVMSLLTHSSTLDYIASEHGSSCFDNI